VIERKKTRSYPKHFLHIEENALKITRSKILQKKELIMWGNFLGWKKDRARRVCRRLWYEKQGSSSWANELLCLALFSYILQFV
jgi:hypothetical protein